MKSFWPKDTNLWSSHWKSSSWSWRLPVIQIFSFSLSRNHPTLMSYYSKVLGGMRRLGSMSSSFFHSASRMDLNCFSTRTSSIFAKEAKLEFEPFFLNALGRSSFLSWLTDWYLKDGLDTKGWPKLPTPTTTTTNQTISLILLVKQLGSLIFFWFRVYHNLLMSSNRPTVRLAGACSLPAVAIP